MSTNSVAAPKSTKTTAPTTGPFLPHEVNLDDIKYSDVKQMGNGPAKMCFLDLGSTKFVLETPWMATYDGIRQPPVEFREPGAQPKYGIEFSLKGYRGENKEIQAFHDLLQRIENKLLDDCCKPEYSFAWHKKKTMVREVAEALFTPIIKLAKDKNTGEISDQYPPKIKLKVPCWEGEWKCDVYKHNSDLNVEPKKVEGDLSATVCGRLEGRAIIQCTGLWFAGSKFGSSWKLMQMEYKPLEQGLKPYAFRSSSRLAEPVVIKDDTTDNIFTGQDEEEDEEEEVIVDSEPED